MIEEFVACLKSYLKGAVIFIRPRNTVMILFPDIVRDGKRLAVYIPILPGMLKSCAPFDYHDLAFSVAEKVGQIADQQRNHV